MDGTDRSIDTQSRLSGSENQHLPREQPQTKAVGGTQGGRQFSIGKMLAATRARAWAHNCGVVARSTTDLHCQQLTDCKEPQRPLLDSERTPSLNGSCDVGKVKPFLASCVLFSLVDRLVVLRKLIKVGVSALALMLAALPVAACVLPDAAMTSAERECCKKMAEQCGDMGMPKSHSCCKVTATPANFHALKTTYSQLDHVSLVPFDSLPLTAQTDEYISLVRWSSRVSCTHSPPGLEPRATTVLRI